jgi:hypothetical protein
MSLRNLFSVLIKAVLIASALLTLATISVAQQLKPASPPIADPRDTRFDDVDEDWSSPALSGSSLRPAQPLSSGVTDHSDYTSQIVRVQWRWADPIDLYVVKPKGVSKPPVLLFLYGHKSDTLPFLDEGFQAGATRGGFAAVGFVSALTGPRYHDRPLKEWFVSELKESLAVSAHDVQMILNYLTTRGDLDMTRVGMFAQDSGASIAILASAVDPRIKVLDTVDPWGDWPEWLKGSPAVPEDERASYLKPEFLTAAANLDPLTWLPKVQAKRFRLQDAAFALTTPKVAKEKLRAAAPAGATVVVYKTPEDTKAVMSGAAVLDWMKQELQSLGQTPGLNKLADQSPVGVTSSSRVR